MARPHSSLSRLISKRPPSKATAQSLLREHGFREPQRALGAITRLYGDELQRASLAKVFSRLMRACAGSADPDRALLGFERLVAALPNAGMFYHYLQSAPERIELLVTVFA